MNSNRRALFLDRDGVLNELVASSRNAGRAPWDWSEVRFCKGLEALQVLRERGYLLILVTNQPDIERGLVTRRFVEELNGYFIKKFCLTAAYYCPSADPAHIDKKPNPGMALRAARDYSIDLASSWLLGDTESDTGTARSAGCRSILIDRPYNREIEADRRIGDVNELLLHLG